MTTTTEVLSVFTCTPFPFLLTPSGMLETPAFFFRASAEACNAEANKEPLSRRWMRGMVPRGGREMIFGIGINQLSDACEERVSRGSVVVVVTGKDITIARKWWYVWRPHWWSTTVVAVGWKRRHDCAKGGGVFR